MTPQLAATEFLDHDSDAIHDYVDTVIAGVEPDDRTRAVALYLAVRDGIHYDVYGADLTRTGLRASTVLTAGSGMCLHKSTLYATTLRAIGVPSRLVLTDVRNHLSSGRLRDLVGGDVFRYHCLVSVCLGGRWVRATPVFNRTLCRLYRMTPLEFDGRTDSLYHPYDLQGRRHMEVIHEYGEFDDLPYDVVIDGLRTHHPKVFADQNHLVAGCLATEARPNDIPGSPS